jgi:hypothetical protein
MNSAAVQLVPPPSAAADGDARARARIAALEQVLESGLVTFHDVASAWFAVCDGTPGAAALYSRLQAAFEAPRGGIVTAYFCENVPVAAALTDIRTASESHDGVRTGAKSRCARPRPEASSSAIHLETLRGAPDDPQAKALLYRCVELHYRALEFLAPQPRKICVRALFAIVGAVLGALDAGSTPDYACLRAELARIEAYYRRSAARQARLTYLAGMAAAALVAGALAALSAARREPLAAAALCGAAGGIVSVLMRMSRGQLAANAEVGDATLCVLGFGRVLLGALLGGAVCVLLEGGILPTPAQAGPAFFAGAAFLAGFTERIMGDAIGGDHAASSRGSSRMSSKTTVLGPAS